MYIIILQFYWYHVTDCCTMYTRAILLHENAYEMGNTDPIHEDGDILGMK